AMQVASMNPVAVDRDSVPAAIVESERNVAIEKTKEELVKKAVNNALSKAGLNPNHFDTDAHIDSNLSKGWINEEEAAKGRQIIAEASEAAAASIKEQMVQNIATGRVNKFFKESCLMEQEFIKEPKETVAQYLNGAMKGLTVSAFKRVNLNQD
ncbi:MAG: elongation factor Ts, partial [Muribaculaceae bacterium]|nr:elongation factor Ts [Muribaculaceae bacterium]